MLEASSREADELDMAADDGSDKANVDSESSDTSKQSGVLDAQCQERQERQLSETEASSSSDSSGGDESSQNAED
jgi:hypothetical protein